MIMYEVITPGMAWHPTETVLRTLAIVAAIIAVACLIRAISK